MKPYLPLFLLIVMYSCGNVQKPATQNLYDEKLMAGEWWLDSSSNRHFSRDKLILLENGELYVFSRSHGGLLWLKGKKFGKDSLVTDFEKFRMNLVDSNMLCISAGPNRQDFYKRFDNGDYHKNLETYLKSDSLRRKSIGWWKLIPTRATVDLINYNGRCNKFTLNIRGDGKAVFYLENKLDSEVEYTYDFNPDGIDFSRECVTGSDSKINFDSIGRMKLVLTKNWGDTLLLERITEIE